MGLVSRHLKHFFTRERIIFLAIFAVIALAAMQINFSPLLGVENQQFTLFQFFGPIAAGFLGPVVGVISVFAAETANFFIVGKEFAFINLFRLTPMLFAAFYFGAKGRKNLVVAVPIVAMALFMLHPIGGEVWYYSLYWLIPVIALLFKKNLFLKSLGTTFTAHSVGSVIFLYSIPTTAALWRTLIPIVAYERIMFAIGISLSYIIIVNFLGLLKSRVPSEVVHIEEKYNFVKKLFKVRV